MKNITYIGAYSIKVLDNAVTLHIVRSFHGRIIGRFLHRSDAVRAIFRDMTD